MKRQFYLWHRWLGLFACLAAVVWCFSGFLHPIMSWTQPRPPVMFLKSPPISSAALGVSLDTALRQQQIKTFADFNLVSFNGSAFYQVKTDAGVWRYLNVGDGQELADGDKQYAVHLARAYLNDQQSPVTGIEEIKEFDSEYKLINKLLPVYKVSFARDDGMRAYVDTTTGNLSTLVNNTKGRLMWLFSVFHNWEFVGFNDTFRRAAQILFSLITFCVAVSGIAVYALFWKKFKSQPVDGRSRLRKYHRLIGISVSVTMLMFASSGAYHVIEKGRINEEFKTMSVAQQFDATELTMPLAQIIRAASAQPVSNISLVRLDGQPCYQILRADRQMDYVSAKTAATIADGHERYARLLANEFSQRSDKEIASVTVVNQFNQEYGFINKRLPVVRVGYNDAEQTRYFVEPAAGVLALKLGNTKGLESYSFNFLHKWHFLDWAGKTTRDITMMAFVFFNALVSLMGLWMFALWCSPQKKGQRARRRGKSVTPTPQPAPVHTATQHPSASSGD